MDIEKLGRLVAVLEHENMIMRSALSGITHMRKGCFLSQKENWERNKKGEPRTKAICVKADKCFGCMFVDIVANAYKEMNAS